MNKRGVTLVELIIVFVIIGFLATLMVPGFGAWLPRYRLRSATRDIVSTLRSAQMRAVSESKPYTVSFNTADTGIASNTGYAYAGAVRTLPTGITIVSNTLIGLKAEFDSDCTCPSAGSITLENTKGGQNKITILSSTGRVTIE